MKRTFLMLATAYVVLLALYVPRHYVTTAFDYRQAHPSNAPEHALPCEAQGYIEAWNPEKHTAMVRIQVLNGVPFSQLWCVDSEHLASLVDRGDYGVWLMVDVSARAYKAPKNQGGFDYDRYLYSLGVSRRIRPLKVAAAQDIRVPVLTRFALDSRQFIGSALKQLPPEANYFLSALILGEKETYNGYDRVKALGLAHVFAISGLHFSLLHRLLRRCTWDERHRGGRLLRLLCLGVVSCIIGRSYSARRAFWTIVYGEGCGALNRKRDVYTAVAFSAFMILITDPWAILSTALHLSFFAYAAVVILYKKLCARPLKYKALEAVRFAMVVHLALTPITLSVYGKINVMGWVANALMVPIVGVVLPLGLAYLLAQGVGLGMLASALSAVLAAGVTGFNGLVSILPLWSISVPVFKHIDIQAILACVLFCILTLCHYPLYQKRRRYGGILAICIVAVLGVHAYLESTACYIEFFDVGHGDAALIRTPEYIGLIDTGDGRTPIEPLLRYRGIHHLDFVILSHAHADHIGGLEALAQALPIRAIYVNEETAERLEGKVPKQQLRRVAAPLRLGTRNQLEILPFFSSEDTNDNTLVVYLDEGSLRGYFLGDAGAHILERLPIQESSTFIKVAHHGSKTGYSPVFYENNPNAFPVMSHNHKYRFPHASVEALLNDRDTGYGSTYACGGIRISERRGQLIYTAYYVLEKSKWNSKPFISN